MQMLVQKLIKKMLTTMIRDLILLLFKEVLRLLRTQYCAVRSETTMGSWDRELCLRRPETLKTGL